MSYPFQWRTYNNKIFRLQSEYDNYIAHLLDSQTPQHSRLLRDQVEQMSTRGTSRPTDLDDAKQRVANLEDSARQSIEENERWARSILFSINWWRWLICLA